MSTNKDRISFLLFLVIGVLAASSGFGVGYWVHHSEIFFKKSTVTSTIDSDLKSSSGNQNTQTEEVPSIRHPSIDLSSDPVSRTDFQKPSHESSFSSEYPGTARQFSNDAGQGHKNFSFREQILEDLRLSVEEGRGDSAIYERSRERLTSGRLDSQDIQASMWTLMSANDGKKDLVTEMADILNATSDTKIKNNMMQEFLSFYPDEREPLEKHLNHDEASSESVKQNDADAATEPQVFVANDPRINFPSSEGDPCRGSSEWDSLRCRLHEDITKNIPPVRPAPFPDESAASRKVPPQELAPHATSVAEIPSANEDKPIIGKADVASDVKPDDTNESPPPTPEPKKTGSCVVIIFPDSSLGKASTCKTPEEVSGQWSCPSKILSFESATFFCGSTKVLSFNDAACIKVSATFSSTPSPSSSPSSSTSPSSGVSGFEGSVRPSQVPEKRRSIECRYSFIQ